MVARSIRAMSFCFGQPTGRPMRSAYLLLFVLPQLACNAFARACRALGLWKLATSNLHSDVYRIGPLTERLLFSST